MSIIETLGCVIGFIVFCIVIYNITEYKFESRENRKRRVAEWRERAQHNA